MGHHSRMLALLIVTLALACGALSAPLPGHAADQAEIYLEVPPPQTVEVGAIVEAHVMLKALGDASLTVAGVDFEIGYDSSVLAVEPVTVGDQTYNFQVNREVLSDLFKVEMSEPLRLAATATDPNAGFTVGSTAVRLATVRFRILALQNTELSLTCHDLLDVNTQPITCTTRGAALNLTPSAGEATIAGQLTWQVAPKTASIPEAEVGLWSPGASRSEIPPLLVRKVSIGIDGRFLLAGLDPGTYDVTLKVPYGLRVVVQGVLLGAGATTNVDFGEVVLGDAWGKQGPDNVINARDYAAILYSFGTVSGQERFIDTCDFNRDGVINVRDYAVVLFNFGKVGAAPF